MSRDALREYVRGSLWVLSALSVLVVLAAGAALSSVRAGSRSPLAFQGTPDDARTLLLGITGTMITIIALLLGQAVVALQLSSTQFSRTATPDCGLRHTESVTLRLPAAPPGEPTSL